MPGNVFVAGAVRGLLCEGDRIADIISKLEPDAVGLAVSREGLAAMEGLAITDKEMSRPTNTEERIYIRGLSSFGEVVKPPPCFSAALKSGIPVTPLDMDDEHYTAAYCRYVSTLDIMRQGRDQKSMLRHRFRAASPREFVLEWDRVVNRLRGYRALEASREMWLAKGACRMAEKYPKTLVVVEYERLHGVLKYLDKLGCGYNIME
jgi:hypothetical protein